MDNIQALKTRTQELQYLGHASALVGWDQMTYMPHGGGEQRSNQLATLSKLTHQMLTSPAMGDILAKAEEEAQNLNPDSDDARLVKVVRRDYNNSTKLPNDFVAEFTKTASLAHEVWAKARQEDDFAAFQPALEKIVELCRRQAEYLGYKEHIYDALIDLFEAGMTTADVQTIFDSLKTELVPFAQALYERQDRASDEVLHQHYPKPQQETFGRMIAERLGFDFNRGRQDVSVHPFCTSFSADDVRITTRFDENFLPTALFGTIHETGHAMYEQGIGRPLVGTYLGSASSLIVHESQSRLWENVVGRSYGFWQVFYRDLQNLFPESLGNVALDDFYRAINTVKPSLIRVEADEVSYSLHIMIRFELEKELLTGQLAVKDLPEAWKAKFEDYLGITPPNNRLGCLQDVHWAGGGFGYFPTYSLGSMLASQLYDKAIGDNPNIPTDLQAGHFDSLREWLHTHIHQHGRKFIGKELIVQATGKPLGHDSYMKYLKAKFSPIYGL